MHGCTSPGFSTFFSCVLNECPRTLSTAAMEAGRSSGQLVKLRLDNRVVCREQLCVEVNMVRKVCCHSSAPKVAQNAIEVKSEWTLLQNQWSVSGAECLVR